MTRKAALDERVAQILHKAHRDYQKSQLGKPPESETTGKPRGAVREKSHNEKDIPGGLGRADLVARAAWFTHLRPNFWKTFIESQAEYSGMTRRDARRFASQWYKLMKSDRADPKID